MFVIPFTEDVYTPDDETIPGNSTAVNPVQFDISPAQGPDMARLKSLIYADFGLTHATNWSPETQEAVIKAFETAGPVFQNTVSGVRGLAVPAALAVKVGILGAMPTKVDPQDPNRRVPDREQAVPVSNGLDFSRVQGYFPVLALRVGMAIMNLNGQAPKQDQRFFEQPSGSGGRKTRKRTPGNVPAAQSRSRRRETAGESGQTASGQTSTSRPD
jgi:hypothetical protein